MGVQRRSRADARDLRAAVEVAPEEVIELRDRGVEVLDLAGEPLGDAQVHGGSRENAVDAPVVHAAEERP